MLKTFLCIKGILVVVSLGQTRMGANTHGGKHAGGQTHRFAPTCRRHTLKRRGKDIYKKKACQSYKYMIFS